MNAKKYHELAIQKNPGQTDAEKRILQNSRDKLKELDKWARQATHCSTVR